MAPRERGGGRGVGPLFPQQCSALARVAPAAVNVAPRFLAVQTAPPGPPQGPHVLPDPSSPQPCSRCPPHPLFQRGSRPASHLHKHKGLFDHLTAGFHEQALRRRGLTALGPGKNGCRCCASGWGTHAAKPRLGRALGGTTTTGSQPGR